MIWQLSASEKSRLVLEMAPLDTLAVSSQRFKRYFFYQNLPFCSLLNAIICDVYTDVFLWFREMIAEMKLLHFSRTTNQLHVSKVRDPVWILTRALYKHEVLHGRARCRRFDYWWVMTLLENRCRQVGSCRGTDRVSLRHPASHCFVSSHNCEQFIEQDAQLSQRDRAAGCVIVFAKSRTLELGDNDLRTL